VSSGSSQPPRRPRPSSRREPARRGAAPQLAGLPPWALPAAGAVVLLLVIVLIARGCGEDGLSAEQLRVQATEICAAANRVTDRIAVPNASGGGERFLVEGLAVLRPAVRRLALLQAPEELRDQYERAVAQTSARLDLIARTARQINRGGDTIDEYRALQQQLERRSIAVDASWRALGIPACASR
jgi:hypothetical protein